MSLKQIVTASTLLLISTNLWAQALTTEPVPPVETSKVASQGIRLGFFKSFLEMELAGPGDSVKGTLDDTMGLSVGYANLPVQDVGFSSELSYLFVKEDSSSADLIRLDANIAYAFNSNVYLKAGPNISKFVRGGIIEDLNPSLGFQVGVGGQLSKNIGGEIKFVKMAQSGKIHFDGLNNDQFGAIDSVNVNTDQSGVELGLNATF